MFDKFVGWIIKALVALIAVNLVWCLLLELLRQHPFQGLLAILIASAGAYVVRLCRAKGDGRPRRGGGNERTPMMPRGWDQ